MTQEEKQLLLADLSARLPYGVKVNINGRIEVLDSICDDDGYHFNFIGSNKEGVTIEDVKPYLFPLSSMTEEQKNQLKEIWSADMDKAIDYSISGEERLSGLCELSAARKVIDWLIANHFNYHGLIPMGLANDATGLNIY